MPSIPNLTRWATVGQMIGIPAGLYGSLALLDAGHDVTRLLAGVTAILASLFLNAFAVVVGRADQAERKARGRPTNGDLVVRGAAGNRDFP